jgi:hypothetical protein
VLACERDQRGLIDALNIAAGVGRHALSTAGARRCSLDFDALVIGPDHFLLRDIAQATGGTARPSPEVKIILSPLRPRQGGAWLQLTAAYCTACSAKCQRVKL